MKQLTQQMLQQAANSQPKKSAIKNYSESTETLPHSVDGQSLSLPIPEWINTKFNEAFQNKWGKKALPSTWIQGIGVLTVDQIRKAVSRSLIEGDGWPPSLPEFIKLGRESGFDYQASFDRFINHERLSDIEFFAAQDVGHECRTKLPEEAARKKWKAAIIKYEQRANEGTLPARKQKAIAHTDVKVKADWMAPDGNMYTCPAEYYASLNKG